MDSIFMNSEDSTTSDSHRLLVNLIDGKILAFTKRGKI